MGMLPASQDWQQDSAPDKAKVMIPAVPAELAFLGIASQSAVEVPKRHQLQYHVLQILVQEGCQASEYKCKQQSSGMILNLLVPVFQGERGQLGVTLQLCIVPRVI